MTTNNQNDENDVPGIKTLFWVFFVLATIGLDTGSAAVLWWAAWNELPVNPPLVFTTIVLVMNFLVLRWMLIAKD